MEEDRRTCAQLDVHDAAVKKTLFVKSVWNPTKASPTSFSLAATDGCQAWTFEGSEAYVKERAEVWDKEVGWVMEKLKFYLTMGQPGVTYRFTKTRDDYSKLSFDIQDKDTNLSLRANLQMLDASSENVTCDLLGFLLHGNEKLSMDYRRKCRDFDKILAENKALVELSEKYKNENTQFKKDATEKFVGLLNSKKSKCRELRKENARLTELLWAKEDIEKNCSTSSSGDDDEEKVDDDQQLLERGEGSGKSLVSEDAPAPSEEDPLTTITLLADAPYTGLQRKRRRP